MKRNTTALLTPVLLLGLAWLAAPTFAAPPEKIEICHIPPANPDNVQTILVGPKAAVKHMDEHGDFEVGMECSEGIGECEVFGETVCVAGEDVCTASAPAEVLVITFVYLNEDCTSTTNTQEGEAECEDFGDSPPGEPVDVFPADPAGTDVNPSVALDVGDIFTISPVGSALREKTEFRIEGFAGAQSLTIQTACARALSACDQFGSVKIVELVTTFGVDTCADQ